MKLALIAGILVTSGHYWADAAVLPNSDINTLVQCGYSAARLIENPLKEQASSRKIFPLAVVSMATPAMIPKK
jgi:hypothetical protein